jgi:hypothetical protein
MAGSRPRCAPTLEKDLSQLELGIGTDSHKPPIRCRRVHNILVISTRADLPRLHLLPMEGKDTAANCLNLRKEVSLSNFSFGDQASVVQTGTRR